MSTPDFPTPDPATRTSVPPVVSPPLPYTYSDSPPRAPWSAGRKAVLIVGIVAASTGLLAGIGVGVVALASVITEVADRMSPVIDSAQPPPDIRPLIEGEPSSPVALEPESCPDVCFNGASIAATILPDAEFNAIGIGVEASVWGDVPDSGIGAEYGFAAGAWADRSGTPDECFVTHLPAPIAFGVEERPQVVGDSLHWTGTHSDADGFNSIGTVVRVASDTDAAVDHMARLDSMLSMCDSYEIGRGADYWSADVSRAPQLEVPRSVAAVGWVEDSPYGRFYTIDLQRSNLIVRVAGYTDGMFSEADFRRIAEAAALQLSTIKSR